MMRSSLSAVALFLLVPGLAFAKQLPVAELSSNSTLTHKETGVVYEAGKALNDNVADMWIEGEGSAGLGKYVEAKFDGDVEVAGFRIWAGCFIDKEFWERHNRIKSIELKYPDFTSERIELEDKMEPQFIKLKEPKTLSKVKIYLRATYDGNTWNDTPITKLEFFDKGGIEAPIEGFKVSASSEYPDEDHAYAPALAGDGWLDSHWVEGGETGEGEWLMAEFEGDQTISKFGISVGFDTTDSFFAGANRAGRVTLTFSDGSNKEFKLEDKKGLQTFDLGVSTQSVRVTFHDIIKGKTNNDLYVGELRFWK